MPTEIADAIATVVGKATEAIRANEEGSRQGGDIEHVHQMRVATRRIRAYLKAARPVLDGEIVTTLREDLSALAATLGAVRDLDVMIDRMHREAAALGEPDTAALERLISSLDTERDSDRLALVAVLDRPDYQDMLVELDSAAADPPVVDPWADLTDLAAAEWRKLARAKHKLDVKYGEHPPDDDLHELRIYGKRARYAAELLPKRTAVSRFLATLADLQEVLGDHQDACVLEERLRAMVAGAADPDAALAAGRVIEGCRGRRRSARAEFPPAWARVESAGAKAFRE
jgi:CHAD domain-containing protein